MPLKNKSRGPGLADMEWFGPEPRCLGMLTSVLHANQHSLLGHYRIGEVIILTKWLITALTKRLSFQPLSFLQFILYIMVVSSLVRQGETCARCSIILLLEEKHALAILHLS